MKQIEYEHSIDTSISKKETTNTDILSNDTRKKKKKLKDKSINSYMNIESNNNTSKHGNDNILEFNLSNNETKFTKTQFQLSPINDNINSVITYRDTSLNSNKQNILKRIPKKLHKTFGVSFTLFCISIILLCFGISRSLTSSKLEDWLPLIVLGVIIGLPGFYYTFQFCRICYENNPIKRDNIIKQIPKFKNAYKL